ncbi:MAG: hypothetical protein GXP26_13215 [Planctomycetes bacterium]|nr:hypothetical protein [Planctomycetota bacterium]
MQTIDETRKFILGQIKSIASRIPAAKKVVAEAQKEVDELEADKSRLESSLAELKPGKKKSKAGDEANKATKPKKTSVKQKDVREVCLAVVKENPAISKVDLENFAKHKLEDDLGFDLKGFGLRFGEVLSSDIFAVAPDETVSIAAARLQEGGTKEDAARTPKATIGQGPRNPQTELPVES